MKAPKRPAERPHTTIPLQDDNACNEGQKAVREVVSEAVPDSAEVGRLSAAQ
jgi:hypothetical protein